MTATDFLAGGGAMRARIRAHDWSTSSIGPPGAWPQSLRTVLSLVLHSGFPAYLAWGLELVSFHNDAYLPILGTKPDALGRPVREVWPEVWDEVGPIMARALSGEASYFEDLPLTLEREGYPEETWWTFSYSPICTETGGVGGLLCIVHETTERVFTERRLRFLDDLSGRMRGLSDPREVMAVAAEKLGRHLGAGRAGYGEIDAADTVFTAERDWTDGAMPSLAGRHRLGGFGLPIIDALKAGHTVRLDDVLADPRTAGESVAAAFAAIGMRAGISAPFMDGGRLAAALYVHQAEPRRWRDDEVALMEEVAGRTWEAVRRARAETALRESEERFRQFAEHSTNVLWIFDAETNRPEYLSPAYEQVWGESRDVLMQDWSRWTGRLHPDDRERVLDVFEGVLGGDTTTCEYRIVRADGSVRWIRDTLFPIRDEHGRVRRAAGLAQNITRHEGALVYVVDGGEAALQTLTPVLQGAGYEVKVFATVRAFLDAAPVLVPGCAVLDVSAADAGGLTIPRELRARRIGLPLIATGEHRGDVGLAVQAMKAGAIDYLEAPYTTEALLAAVASALAGIQDAAGHDRAAEDARARVAALSAREREVLDGLLVGGTNKTIGKKLGISPRTVEIHRAHLMDRLGARTLPEAVLKATAGLKPSRAQVAGGGPDRV